MTFVPDVANDDGLSFTWIDAPGFRDNRGAEINIANAVNIKTTIHAARSVRVVVLLDYHSLFAARGTGIMQLTKILTDLFGRAEQLVSCAPSILLGVSRCPRVDGDADEIELDDIKQLMSDRSNMTETMAACVAALTKSLFLYHPADNGNESWSTREEIIARLHSMETVKDASAIFRTVLTIEGA